MIPNGIYQFHEYAIIKIPHISLTVHAVSPFYRHVCWLNPHKTHHKTLCFAISSQDFPTISYDFAIFSLWFLVFSQDFPMISYDFAIFSLWFPMILPYFPHDFLWFCHIFPMISYDFAIFSLWFMVFSQDFPMIYGPLVPPQQWSQPPAVRASFRNACSSATCRPTPRAARCTSSLGWRNDGYMGLYIIIPYGSKHCLRRYLSLQIIVNYTPNTS